MDAWGTPLEAVQSALELKKRVNQSLLDLHDLANARDDAQVRLFARILLVCLHARSCACLTVALLIVLRMHQIKIIKYHIGA